MLRATLPILAMLLVPATAQAPGADAQGEIVLGLGDTRLWPDLDHAFLVAPHNAIGFNYEGDVRYEYARLFNGGGEYYRVLLFSPLGTHHVPYSVQWVTQGTPEVRFQGIFNTTCLGLLCDPVLPLP